MKKFSVQQIHNSEDNPFDRQERIDWWNQERLQCAKVMVVGAGAIGNETLKNLALLGVGHIFIVDFDDISTSNLSRTVLFRKEDKGKLKAEIAAQRTKEIALSNDIRIDWLHADVVWELGTGLYQEMDIILGCLDNVETRLAVNRHCILAKKPWIDAGIFELGLRVNFYNTPEVPCYQCNISPQQLSETRKRYSCDDFKKKVYADGKIPTVQIASAIVSAIQVQEAIKYLCGQPVAKGKQIYFQGKTNDFDVFDLETNPDCYAHAEYPEVIQLDIDTESSLRNFLELVSSPHYAGEGATLDFRGDRTFVCSVACRSCRQKIVLMRPSFRIYDTETICPDCRTKGKVLSQEDAFMESIKETIGQFSLKDTPSEILALSLHAIGVPYMHIVGVVNAEGNYFYFLLAGDRKKILPSFYPKV